MAARICPDRGEVLGPLAASVGYSGTLSVAVVTSKPLDNPAVLVFMPSPEDAEIALSLLEHNNCTDRASAGCGLIEVHRETDAAARHLDLSRRGHRRTYPAHDPAGVPELEGAVDFTQVTRWPLPLPHSTVGTFRHLETFHTALHIGDRIQFAADSLSSAAQNTAVRFGTAENLVASLG